MAQGQGRTRVPQAEAQTLWGPRVNGYNVIQALKGPRKPTPLRLTFAGFKVNLPGVWGAGGGEAHGSHHVSPTRPELSAACPFSPSSTEALRRGLGAQRSGGADPATLPRGDPPSPVDSQSHVLNHTKRLWCV